MHQTTNIPASVTAPLSSEPAEEILSSLSLPWLKRVLECDALCVPNEFARYEACKRVREARGKRREDMRRLRALREEEEARKAAEEAEAEAAAAAERSGRSGEGGYGVLRLSNYIGNIFGSVISGGSRKGKEKATVGDVDEDDIDSADLENHRPFSAGHPPTSALGIKLCDDPEPIKPNTFFNSNHVSNPTLTDPTINEQYFPSDLDDEETESAVFNSIFRSGIVYTYMSFSQLDAVKRDGIVPDHVVLQSFWTQAELTNRRHLQGRGYYRGSTGSVSVGGAGMGMMGIGRSLGGEMDVAGGDVPAFPPFRFAVRFRNVHSYFFGCCIGNGKCDDGNGVCAPVGGGPIRGMSASSSAPNLSAISSSQLPPTAPHMPPSHQYQYQHQQQGQAPSKVQGQQQYTQYHHHQCQGYTAPGALPLTEKFLCSQTVVCAGVQYRVQLCLSYGDDSFQDSPHQQHHLGQDSVDSIPLQNQGDVNLEYSPGVYTHHNHNKPMLKALLQRTRITPASTNPTALNTPAISTCPSPALGSKANNTSGGTGPSANIAYNIYAFDRGAFLRTVGGVSSALDSSTSSKKNSKMGGAKVEDVWRRYHYPVTACDFGGNGHVKSFPMPFVNVPSAMGVASSTSTTSLSSSGTTTAGVENIINNNSTGGVPASASMSAPGSTLGIIDCGKGPVPAVSPPTLPSYSSQSQPQSTLSSKQSSDAGPASVSGASPTASSGGGSVNVNDGGKQGMGVGLGEPAGDDLWLVVVIHFK
ncbi:hypothetical protein HK102_004544 [Quaeritorhiza haematococci]|nr:hypothetical protein HK102_004544 [Quaeritorhiza haematococci]